MPAAERLERLRNELRAARADLSHLSYYEVQGMLDRAETAKLAAVRLEIPRLEQAVAEAEGRSLTGAGDPRP